MARAALEHLRLQEVVFMPTGVPRYRRPPVASAGDRVAMLQLAIAGEPRYSIDERELAPQASGYTVDTLRSLRDELGPETALYLLIGADQLAKFSQWHRPDEVRQLAKLAVFARPGIGLDATDVPIIPMPPMPISASEIRARAARGQDLSDALPEAVARYIARRRPYH